MLAKSIDFFLGFVDLFTVLASVTGELNKWLVTTTVVMGDNGSSEMVERHLEP